MSRWQPLRACVPSSQGRLSLWLPLPSGSHSSQFCETLPASAISHFVVIYFSAIPVTGFLSMCFHDSLVSEASGAHRNHLLQMQIPGPFPRRAEYWLLGVVPGNERVIYLLHRSTGSADLGAPRVLLPIRFQAGRRIERRRANR